MEHLICLVHVLCDGSVSLDEIHEDIEQDA